MHTYLVTAKQGYWNDDLLTARITGWVPRGGYGSSVVQYAGMGWQSSSWDDVAGKK